MSRFALVGVAVVAFGASSFPPGSPQDIVTHTRLQALMRQCQQQAREVTASADAQALSRAAMQCLSSYGLRTR
jgi:hypothetical protein